MSEDNEFVVPLGNPSITRYIQPVLGISASDVRRRIAELEAEGLTRELAFMETWMEAVEDMSNGDPDPA